MSAASHTSTARRPASARGRVAVARERPAARRPRPALAATATRYVTLVLPAAREQIDAYIARARKIPDARLRRVALEALAKRGNIEGAALLATLAPGHARAPATRALVAFQAAYNYTDALSELPSADPGANAARLHQALLSALDPDAPQPDYFARDPQRGHDGGLLAATVQDCRAALGSLPRWAQNAPRARAAAARIVDFQTLNRSREQGGHRALAGWAREQAAGYELGWWELAAGAGSSLPVHALIAASADPLGPSARAQAIGAAYFPWVGALHSLLDSLVDRDEDERAGQPSLLEPYGGPRQTLAGLTALAARTRGELAGLADAPTHLAILTAMCSYYLSAPGCQDAHGRAVAAGLTRQLGAPLAAARGMFASWRLARALAGSPYT